MPFNLSLSCLRLLHRRCRPARLQLTHTPMTHWVTHQHTATGMCNEESLLLHTPNSHAHFLHCNYTHINYNWSVLTHRVPNFKLALSAKRKFYFHKRLIKIYLCNLQQQKRVITEDVFNYLVEQGLPRLSLPLIVTQHRHRCPRGSAQRERWSQTGCSHSWDLQKQQMSSFPLCLWSI